MTAVCNLHIINGRST